MSFLLDTNVVSEFTKPRPNSNVVSWLGEGDPEQHLLSVLTIGEVERGLSRIDPVRRLRLAEWLHRELLLRFEERILPVDTSIARRWGALVGPLQTRGITLPVIDSLLASTALTHNFTVVTRNVADFERCGVPVFNPWDA